MSENTYEEKINKAAQLIAESQHLVVFTGAGVSTESGIPDFRGPNGVWTRRDKGLPPPKTKKPWSEVDVNIGHKVIFKLQEMGIMKYLISQNIDGLHLKSGIREENLAEFHGNMTLMRCLGCGKRHKKNELEDNKKCPSCEGKLRSDVVNFGDSIPRDALMNSFTHSQQADVFLVVGSSLTVTPAADMPYEALRNNGKLIIINNQPTGFDNNAEIRFFENAGEILSAILDEVKKIKEIN